ncbi:MAG TPA: hypothetical protein VF469_03375 [Kofleriaceae bacterium]
MTLARIALGISLYACSTPPHKEPPVMNTSSEMTPDEQLVAQLRKAVATAVPLDSVEASVGSKALINTTTGFPLDGLRRVNLVPDPDHADETLALAAAKAVVYWARPVPGDNPHVVGLQVRNDGRMSVFFGIVYPP